MSRIHDALKKAEQERVNPQSADVAVTAEEQPIVAEISNSVWSEALASPDLDTIRATVTVAAPSISEPTKAAPGVADFNLGIECTHPHWSLDSHKSVFLGRHAQAAEQFRTLRSKLYQLRNTQKLKTILVTSAIPQEGKTWVVSNLAQTFVRQSGRRALMIDADLRFPRLHAPFGAPSTPGLTDYLQGKVEESAIIQQGQQSESSLYLIPAGSKVSNASELLSGGRMKGLIDRMAPMFDWIVLDSPPCLSVSDASMLAEFCDGVLVVLRAGRTPIALAEKAEKELRGKNVIGVVLNAVEGSAAYGYPYHGEVTNQNGNGSQHKQKITASSSLKIQ